MARKITKAEARAWRRQWRLVNEAEIQERRTTPIEKKFRQLAAMMQTALVLGWKTSTPEEIEAIRERWIRLKSLQNDAQ